mmetsp:Transcript_19393/g.50979  ORF Transcript_19393/g.50979 Transcript_19393/m.50979 type:complete len:224 (+) Transcript_19393:370-1041(+)
MTMLGGTSQDPLSAPRAAAAQGLCASCAASSCPAARRYGACAPRCRRATARRPAAAHVAASASAAPSRGSTALAGARGAAPRSGSSCCMSVAPLTSSAVAWPWPHGVQFATLPSYLGVREHQPCFFPWLPASVHPAYFLPLYTNSRGHSLEGRQPSRQPPSLGSGGAGRRLGGHGWPGFLRRPPPQRQHASSAETPSEAQSAKLPQLSFHEEPVSPSGVHQSE